jgi:flagellar M-ring protein FliF
VEAEAIGRIAGLLTPLVGAGNFQANVSANLDFTQEHIHQIAYGPGHLVTHQKTSQSTQYGTPGAVLGIPGALSNEPPSPTTASANAAPTPATAGGASATQGGNVVAEQTKPTQNSTDTDQSYVTDQSENDITKPDWSVNSIAVSVVLNKAALHNAATAEQVKAAITGAFAYPNVSVNVLEASFQTSGAGLAGAPLAGAINPLARALLEVMAAAALLFGLALPLGRQLKASNMQALLPQTFQRPIAVVRPARDFTELRDQVSANIPGVARLLQNWVEENE